MRAGEDSAFEELYRRYRPRVTAFVRRSLRDEGRAEDVTQEVFLSALRRMRLTESEIVFKPWIYEIARNAAIDAHRRSRRSQEVSMEALELLRPSDRLRLTGAAAPESSLLARERLRHLRVAFGELSDTHHRVLVMRELEGRSYREIAERLQLTRPAVESALFRARRRLEHLYAELERGRRREDLEPVGRLGSLRKKAAALLPLPALLRRGVAGRTSFGSAAAQGGQAVTAFAERAAALLVAAALASAGSTFLQERLVPSSGPQPPAAETTPLHGFGVPRLVLPSPPAPRPHSARRAGRPVTHHAVPARAAAVPVPANASAARSGPSTVTRSVSLPALPVTGSTSLGGRKQELQSRVTSDVHHRLASTESPVKAVAKQAGQPKALTDSLLGRAKKAAPGVR